MATTPASSKKFKNSNLNAALGAPKDRPVNFGPAVRSAALIKPVAKPKGLVSLGKAPLSAGTNAKKGAAFRQLEEKAKEEESKKPDLSSPEWAVIDINDLDKPLQKDATAAGEEAGEDEDAVDHVADGLASVPEGQAARGDCGENARNERHFRDSHRSYLSMQYSSQADAEQEPPSGDVPPPLPMEESRRFGGPPLDAPPAAPFRSEPPPSAPPPQAPDSPGGEGDSTRRARASSWADATEVEEEEAAAVAAAAAAQALLRPPQGAVGAASSSGREPPPNAAPPPLAASLHGTAAPNISGLPAGPPPRQPPPGPPGGPPPQPPPAVLAVGGPHQLQQPTEYSGLQHTQAPLPARELPPYAQPPQQPHQQQHRPQQPPPPGPRGGAPAASLGKGSPPRPVAPGPPRPVGPPPPMPPPAVPHGSFAPQVPLPNERMEHQQQHQPPPPAGGPRRQYGGHGSPTFAAAVGGAASTPNRSPKAAPAGPRAAEPPQHGGGANGFDRHHYQHGIDDSDRGRPEPVVEDHVGSSPGAWLGGCGDPRGDNMPPPMRGHPEQPKLGWGPAVAYTPAFAPRPPANRPMSEDFVNSGWKEKRLWQPPPPAKASAAADEARGGCRGPGGSPANGPRSRPHAEGGNSAAEKGIAGGLGAVGQANAPWTEDKETDEGAAGAGGSGPSRPPKPAKKSKIPKNSLEALDPDSSSSDDSDDSSLDAAVAAEYAVLDMTVPRTALVINVSHVLKRLNGCCSLNQLTKAIKQFKEKSGVTLEAFLRANPYSFKLEGRIVYLLDKGEKWKPPIQAGDHEAPSSETRGGNAASGGKGGGKGGSAANGAAGKGGSAGGAARRGKGAADKGHAQEAVSSDFAAPASGSGNSKSRRKRGGGGGAAHAAYAEEDYGWEEASWQASEWGSKWKASDWEYPQWW